MEKEKKKPSNNKAALSHSQGDPRCQHGPHARAGGSAPAAAGGRGGSTHRAGRCRAGRCRADGGPGPSRLARGSRRLSAAHRPAPRLLPADRTTAPSRGGPARRGEPTSLPAARSRCRRGAARTGPPSRGCARQGRVAGARLGAAPLAPHRPLPPAPLPARWKSPKQGGRGRGRARGAAPGAGPSEGAAGPAWWGWAALSVLGVPGAAEQPLPALAPASLSFCLRSVHRSRSRSSQPRRPCRARSGAAVPARSSSPAALPHGLGNSAMLSSAAPRCVRPLLALTGKKTILLGKCFLSEITVQHFASG